MRHPSNWLRRIGAGFASSGLQFAQHCAGVAARNLCDDCTMLPKVIRRMTAGSVQNMLARRIC